MLHSFVVFNCVFDWTSRQWDINHSPLLRMHTLKRKKRNHILLFWYHAFKLMHGICSMVLTKSKIFSGVDINWRCPTYWCFWNKGSWRISLAPCWWSRYFQWKIQLFFKLTFCCGQICAYCLVSIGFSIALPIIGHGLMIFVYTPRPSPKGTGSTSSLLLLKFSLTITWYLSGHNIW